MKFLFLWVWLYVSELNVITICKLFLHFKFVIAISSNFNLCKAFVPEWSKGADLSSAIERCVGSNPTGCIFAKFCNPEETKKIEEEREYNSVKNEERHHLTKKWTNERLNKTTPFCFDEENNCCVQCFTIPTFQHDRRINK